MLRPSATRYIDDTSLGTGPRGAPAGGVGSMLRQESEVRRVQIESLRWLTDLARGAGVRRLVVNGSFVTDKVEPNDVDCVLLIGPDFPHDPVAETELLIGLPFVNMELVDQEAFQRFTERTFATDRNMVPKGMIEVVL